VETAVAAPRLRNSLFSSDPELPVIPHSRSAAAFLLAASIALPAGAAFGQTTSYPQQNEGVEGPPPTETGPVAKPKPKGGCLKYGAAGAVGGHLAHHHGVVGAVGGCAVGAYVKHRSKKHIEETGQP
jgi:hypothetical protein